MDNGIERGAESLDDMAEQALQKVGAKAKSSTKGKHQNGKKSASDSDKNDTDGKSATTAQELIAIAHEHCDFFHDERSDGYAVVTYNGIRSILKMRGRDFRRWLAREFYTKTGKAANAEAIAAARSVLEAQATFDGRMLELSNRFAIIDGVIYIDMADRENRVIRVSSVGWDIMDKAPVLFRRYSHQKPLPDPVRGGKLSDLHKHLAIKSDDDKLLVEAWLVTAAFANIPRPIPTFHGPQGASKTTSARILKSITDPSITESVDLGKSAPDLALVLDHNGVPCFDNLTSIQSWAADMLCKAVTGGAFSKRELYSDDSEILMTFKRPIIITGINIPTHAPDLLDRLLLIELERIAQESRMDETTFWAKFDAERPKIFGALLDGIAGALKHLPEIRLTKMPRMADFAKIACAYAEYRGDGAEKMLDIILRHTSRQTQEVVDADPVATAIIDFMQSRAIWTGTSSELLKLLNESQPQQRPDGWPKQANNLSRKLTILHATLNEVGIRLRREKEGSTRSRQLTLERCAESSSASSAPSRSSIHAGFDTDGNSHSSSAASSAPKPSSGKGLDDTDGKDDKSGGFSGGLVEEEI